MEKIIKKLEEIDDIRKLSAEDVLLCVSSDDILIRCDIAAILAKFMTEEWVVNIVLKMLSDLNYLVRCEACETLIYLPTKTRPYLEKLLKVIRSDRSSTVRMYAVSTLNLWLQDSSLRDDDVNEKILEWYEKEDSKRVLVSYSALLYTITGDSKHINTLLAYLDDDDYHIRHNVINNIDDIINQSNAAVVLKKYEGRVGTETAYSVVSSLRERISAYSSRYKE